MTSSLIIKYFPQKWVMKFAINKLWLSDRHFAGRLGSLPNLEIWTTLQTHAPSLLGLNQWIEPIRIFLKNMVGARFFIFALRMQYVKSSALLSHWCDHPNRWVCSWKLHQRRRIQNLAFFGIKRYRQSLHVLLWHRSIAFISTEMIALQDQSSAAVHAPSPDSAGSRVNFVKQVEHLNSMWMPCTPPVCM